MGRTATALTLRGKSVVSLRAKLPLLAEGAPESWVEMAYESAWKGHPSGDFAFTRDALDSIVARFDADENPIPVTYGHPDHSTGQPVPAAGWIREMEVRDGSDGVELWGRVEWTAPAADLIRAGEYRYCSVVVDFAPIDRASGESAGLAEMYELGLTNSPFLPGMTPITLSRVGAPARVSQRSLSMDPKKVLSQVAKALGLPDTVSPEKMKTAFDAVVALMAAMSEDDVPVSAEDVAAAQDPKAACARIVSAATKLRALSLRSLADGVLPEEAPAADAAEDSAALKFIATLQEKTGLDEVAVLAALDANLDAVIALLTGTPDSGMPSDALAASASLARTADAARIVELTGRANEQAKQIATLSADLAKRTLVETSTRVAAHFSRLVAEGKAGEGERDTFLKCCAQSEAITLSQYDARTPILAPVGQIATGANQAPAKGASKANAGDPRLPTYLSIAKSEGLRGDKANARALALITNADRNSDA